jgi:hypothetical protein
MKDNLSEDELNEILPCLVSLAVLVGSGQKVDRRALVNILSQIGVTASEDKLAELELWADILPKAGGDSRNKIAVMTALGVRGIKQAPAELAYEQVMKARQPNPLSVEPPVIDFGYLKPGEEGSMTLRVLGRLVRAVSSSRRLRLTPIRAADGSTLVKVVISGGSAGESFQDHVVLSGEKDELSIQVAARWESLVSEPIPMHKGRFLLLWCPKCVPKVKWKSLLYVEGLRQYRCSNCGRTFPLNDNTVASHNRPGQ